MEHTFSGFSEPQIADGSNQNCSALPLLRPSGVQEKDAGQKARVNFIFLREAGLLLSLATEQRSLSVHVLGLLAVMCVTVVVALWTSAIIGLDDSARLWACRTMLALSIVCLSGYLFCSFRNSNLVAVKQSLALRRHSFVMLLLTVQIYNIAGFFTALVPALFYEALAGNRSGCQKLPKALWVALLRFGATLLAKAIMQLAADAMGLLWRDALTQHLQDQYFDGLTFYHVRALNPAIDNPDQRIAQETASFTTGLSTLLCVLFQALFSIAWYSLQTWCTTGWSGPVMIYIISLLGVILTKLLASPIAGLVARADGAEGDFRRRHVQLLASSEQVAFAGQAAGDAALIGEAFTEVLRLRWAIVRRSFILNVGTFFLDYMGAVVGYLAVGAGLCAGLYAEEPQGDLPAIVSRGTAMAMMLANGFTQIVDCGGKASELSGQSHRLITLLQALEEARAESESRLRSEFSDGHRAIREEVATSDREEAILLQCEALSVRAPGSASDLLHDVSFSLRRGGSLLIAGPSGCGKSSLLRVLRGLWRVGKGNIYCAPPLSAEDLCGRGSGTACIFLTAEPHLLIAATLRQQLSYPLPAAALTSEHALKALQAVGLGPEVGDWTLSLDMVRCDWNAWLSRGQQQRLSLARLFVHRPALAVLDESLAGLGIQVAVELHLKLRELGVAVITVGHEMTSEIPHDSVLWLGGS